MNVDEERQRTENAKPKSSSVHSPAIISVIKCQVQVYHEAEKLGAG